MNAPLTPWLVVTGTPADGFTYYGPFAHAEDAGDYGERWQHGLDWWIVPIHSVGGAIGRAERFVASGGDTEVLLEGLPEAWDENGTRRVTVSFSVEVGAKDDRSSAEIAEAIMAEYGHRGGDATMFLEPIADESRGNH